MRYGGTPVRRRWMVLAAVSIVAVVAAACLPPKPAPKAAPAPTPAAPATTKPPSPPPPLPTTTSTTTTTNPPPPSICGVSASSAGPAAAAASDAGGANPNRYTAVVKHAGRSKVLTRDVHTPAEIAKFRADAAAQGTVLAFAQDGEVHALAEQPTWGFTDANFATAWTEPTATTGTGVRVAVLDTGVLAGHPDLSGHFDATPGADFTASTTTPTLGVTTDPNGHGTHVSGILAATAGNNAGVEGGAPGVTLVPVRVLDSSGAGSYATVAAGILWAADKTKGNARVLSMSLGGGDDGDTVGAALATIEDPANTQYTHPAVVIAAGNSGCQATSYPAAYAGPNKYEPALTKTGFAQVIAVSALCKPGTTGSCPSANPFPSDAWRLATFSSLAWNVSGNGIAAPGTEINSTWPSGDQGVVADYNILSGTSMATPFVAAAAALVTAHCGSAETGAQVVARLEASAHDLGPAGVDKLYGSGMVDADNAVKGC